MNILSASGVLMLKYEANGPTPKCNLRRRFRILTQSKRLYLSPFTDTYGNARWTCLWATWGIFVITVSLHSCLKFGPTLYQVSTADSNVLKLVTETSQSLTSSENTVNLPPSKLELPRTKNLCRNVRCWGVVTTNSTTKGVPDGRLFVSTSKSSTGTWVAIIFHLCCPRLPGCMGSTTWRMGWHYLTQATNGTPQPLCLDDGLNRNELPQGVMLQLERRTHICNVLL